MDNKQIIEKYESESVKSIFGYMFGKPFIISNLGIRKDRIIEIRKECLELGESGTSFVYVWGMPGPDFNIYWFSDYGITWAFTKEELEGENKDESNS